MNTNYYKKQTINIDFTSNVAHIVINNKHAIKEPFNRELELLRLVNRQLQAFNDRLAVVPITKYIFDNYEDVIEFNRLIDDSGSLATNESIKTIKKSVKYWKGRAGKAYSIWQVAIDILLRNYDLFLDDVITGDQVIPTPRHLSHLAGANYSTVTKELNNFLKILNLNSYTMNNKKINGVHDAHLKRQIEAFIN